MYKYAADPSTEILCFAYKFKDEKPFLWVPKSWRYKLVGSGLEVSSDEHFQNAVNEADIIEAHNLGFELVMWQDIMVKRHGFNPLPMSKLRCSAVKAAYFNLPRALGFACKAIGIKEQKDVGGYRLMLKMCKPKRPSKKDPGIWHETSEDFKRLCEYCLQDIISEECLSEALPDIPESELTYWRTDLRINERGFCVDRGLVEKIIDDVQLEEIDLLKRIKTLTGGKVESVRQIAASIAWLKGNGLKLDNLQKQTVDKLLNSEGLKPHVKEFLTIRQSLGKSSVSKYIAYDNMAMSDNRVRGSLLFYGASNTGRYAGRGVQPQNMPRNCFKEGEVNEISLLDRDQINLLYGSIFENASKCLRGMIIPSNGHVLICADYSQVEARVLAWLAGEEKVLNAFRNGKDVYRVTASDIYGRKPEEINDSQRQVGKVIILACGYQGWLGAFEMMGKSYKLLVAKDSRHRDRLLKDYGSEYSVIYENDAKDAILFWRRANPAIVKLWAGLEMAAIKTIRTRKSHGYGRIKFGIRGRFLHMRLPSGRLLSYCDPSIKEMVTPYGEMKMGIRFMGVDSVTKKWGRQATYGGKLAENCWIYSTPVLTDKGWKPISSIKLKDKVFNGERFVFHGGASLNGIKEAGLWQGVLVTENHLIKIGSRWKKVIALGDRYSYAALKTAQNSGSLPLSSRDTAMIRSLNAFAVAGVITKSILERCLGVRHCDAIFADTAKAEIAVGNTMKSCVAGFYLRGFIGIRALFQGAITKSRKHTKTMGVGESNCMGLGARILKNFLNTQKRLIIGIRLVLILTGLTITVITLQTTLGLFLAGRTLTIDALIRFCGTGAKSTPQRILKRFFALCGNITRYIGIPQKVMGQSRYWKRIKTTVPVYDILNVEGHQYVVLTDRGPIIAHNCTQAVSRDLLVNGIENAEENGFPVVLHVHDEIISEIKEHLANPKTLERFCEVISELPPWAKGIPLEADGWIGKRYRK